MARGGARAGAGRPKGSLQNPKLVTTNTKTKQPKRKQSGDSTRTAVLSNSRCRVRIDSCFLRQNRPPLPSPTARRDRRGG